MLMNCHRRANEIIITRKACECYSQAFVLTYVHQHTSTTVLGSGTITAKERERVSSGMSEHLREAPSISRGCNARKNNLYKSPWLDMSANFLVSRITTSRFIAGAGRREPYAMERELFILCRLSRVGITAGKFNRRSPEASRNDPL